MVRATCSALHCNSSSRTHRDLKFHQFPHDAKRRKIWLLACKRMDVINKDWDFFKYKYVCSKHFQKCMYSKSDNLKRSAVPTLHLSEKPMRHDSSTQTEESIENVRSEFPHVDVKEETLNSPSTYMQIEDIPNDNNDVNINEELLTNIKEETKTDPKIEESEIVEQVLETQTKPDNDDESSNTTSFEDIDMKIDIVENPILPAQFTHTQSPLCAINRIKDESVQTERVIVLSQNTGEEDLNPRDCYCERNTYDDITRAQFFRLCSKFLSPDFCILVKTQMCLDGITKNNEIVQGRAYKRNKEYPFFGHQGVLITPAVGVAVTRMYIDGITKQIENDLTAAGGSGSEGAGVTKCGKRSGAITRKVVSPETFVSDKQMYLHDVRKQLRNDLVEACNAGSEEAGISKGVKECQKEATSEMPVAGKHMDLADLPKPFENEHRSSIGSLTEETAAKRPKLSVPKIVIPFTRAADNAEDDL